MADETQPTGEAEEKKKGGRMGAVLMIVVGLALGGGAGAAVLGPVVGAKLAAGGGDHGEEAASDHGGDHGGGHGEAAAPRLHVIDNLVVNPAGTDGTRFLLVSVAVEPGPDGSVDGLAERDVELRDALIRALAGRTVDDLVSVEARQALAEDLREIVSEVGGEPVGRILFPQYVIQ